MHKSSSFTFKFIIPLFLALSVFLGACSTYVASDPTGVIDATKETADTLNVPSTPETETPATDPTQEITEPLETTSPETEPPVTEPPKTEPPATEPPATEPPATNPPATNPPATDPPAAKPRATDPPETNPPETKPSNVQPIPQNPSGKTYILNTNTMKFHFENCSSVKTIKAENKETYKGTREELIAMGYKPCGRCDP